MTGLQESSVNAGVQSTKAPNQTQPWTPATLPFRCSADLLPATFPSASEIRSSLAIIKQRTGQTVVAIGSEFIVKYGRSTPEREGQTLLFLESCVPTVPAPRLYGMFYDQDELFIVMQRVPGVPLDSLWADLAEFEKYSLTAKLRSVFDQMRSIPCPSPAFFGSVDYGPVPDHLFYSAEADRHISGPFDSETAFNNGLILQYKRIQDMNKFPHFKTSFYQRNLQKVLQNHKPTFTHSDLQRKNVMINFRSGKIGTNSRELDVYLVDWEEAGWYPDYWEHFSIFAGLTWDDDWCTEVEEIVPAWPAETAVMKMLHKDLFF